MIRLRTIALLWIWGGVSAAGTYAGDPAAAYDAILEEALLEGLPGWPEELGRISLASRNRALGLLDRLPESTPAADRSQEGRVRKALLRLEPLAGRNARLGRGDLIAAATGRGAGEWELRARYALGWLDEIEGERERARCVYERLCIDHRGTEAALRAAMGLARLLLREGGGGLAAWWLQGAVDQGASEQSGTFELRELAVRFVLRGAQAGNGWSASTARAFSTEIRNLSGLARGRGGDLLLADRRANALIRLDPTGKVVKRWSLTDIQAVALDPRGEILVAAGQSIFRIGPEGAVPMASQGSFAPVSCLAADSSGRTWVVDRRGERVGLIEPGAGVPKLLRGKEGARVVALAWDGGRLVALESHPARLVEIQTDGSEQIIAEGVAASPRAMASDPAGEIAVLDGKSGEVVLLDSHGNVRDRISARSVGATRPTAIALGWDGSLDLHDETEGRWVRVP